MVFHSKPIRCDAHSTPFAFNAGKQKFFASKRLALPLFHPGLREYPIASNEKQTSTNLNVRGQTIASGLGAGKQGNGDDNVIGATYGDELIED